MKGIVLLTDRNVRELLSMSEAIEAVEKAFLDLFDRRASMPPKSYLFFPEHEGDLRVMPASLGSRFAGVKVVNSHARNPARSLPAVVGTYLLVSQETGMPLGIMDATYLTAVRTGAASAVATKYLAPQDASVAGLVGCGVQAGFQLEALAEVLPIARVLVWAPPDDRDRRDRFIAEMRRRFPGFDLVSMDAVETAAGAEVVCTTTPARSPVVPDSAVRPGTHINAVGADAPGKQELDPAILKRARIFVDERRQAFHGGEVNVPLSRGELQETDIAGSLAELVAGKLPGRTSAEEITVFDSTGLAIEDIAVASLAYEKAIESGVGEKIDL